MLQDIRARAVARSLQLFSFKFATEARHFQDTNVISITGDIEVFAFIQCK